MSVLDALLDARRRDVAEEQLGEAFDTRLHPHRPRGAPGAGQFERTFGSVAKTAARVSPARRGVPQGSGPERPRGAVRSAGESVRSSVNRTRTGVDGTPRAPGAGAEREARAVTPRKLTEKELPGAVGPGPWSRHVAGAAKALRAGTVEDTEHHYRLPGSGGKMGAYRPERIELHARIVRALLQGSGAHSRPEAHFMAGGPASGKSRLLKDGLVHTPGDAVDINPDIVKTMLPEYHALVAAGDKAASSKVHEESSHIAKLLTNIALSRGHHVVIDGVGDSGPGKFASKIKAARDAGHAVSVHYATLDTETALARAKARGEKTGRHVPEGYLRAAHRDVSQRFGEVRAIKGANVRVYDTGGRKTRMVFENGAVTHKRGFARFMAKAR